MRKSIVLVLFLAACGSTTGTSTPRTQPQPGSRGPRADEHLDAARAHAQRAAELARWPEARHSDTGRFDDPASGLWYRNWDVAKDHERLAEVHRSAAAQLYDQYDVACSTLTGEAVSISPIQRYGAGGLPTQDGVLVFLGPEAGPPEKLMAAMRCHQAWMMLSETGTMDDCPLDLEGLRIEAYGDATGVTVEITIKDKKLVPELQRRTATDLEGAARRRAMTTSIPAATP